MDVPTNYKIEIETILPRIIFDDLSFLKTISLLGEIEENTLTLRDVSTTEKWRNYGDKINEYKLNSLGYRSKEFKKVPVVFAGCSITFGVGVPYDGIWSTLVGETLGLDYINLSAPGWSAQTIVDNLFKYFYTYGKPEKLFVVFPDYHRLLLTSNRDFCVISPHDDGSPPIYTHDAALTLIPVDSRPKYAKKPYEFVDFIGPEYALMQNFKAINSLIAYCRDSNIDLVWSTWDNETHGIIDIAKNNWNKEAYSNYVYSNFSFNGDRKDNHIDKNSYPECHSEYVVKYKESFFEGQDYLGDQNTPSHPGVHYHIHLAETMLKGLNGSR
jgi:hypothetical protein